MASEAPAILVAMALPAEGAGRFEAAGIPVLYTGVGKVNAAIALTRRLAALARDGGRLPLVVNFGTAGSARLPAQTLVACRRFVDRDMDVGALGFAPGVTPFDELPAMLEFPAIFPEPAGGRLRQRRFVRDRGPRPRLRRGGHGSLRARESLPDRRRAVRLREVRQRRRERALCQALEGERRGRG